MVPKFTEFYIPVLQLLSDVELRDINTIVKEVANNVGLTESDKSETTKGGSQPRYRSNITWALTDLSQGGFIERKARGVYEITLDGLELLEDIPVHPDRDWLAAKSIKFKDFLNRQGSRKAKNKLSEQPEEKHATSESNSGCDNGYDNNAIFGNQKNESDNVTLAELYQTRDILTRANLSVAEVEVKIKRLEKEIEIDKFISDLEKVWKRFSSIIDSGSEGITVDFQQDEIAIKIGNLKKTYSINNTAPNATVCSPRSKSRGCNREITKIQPSPVEQEIPKDSEQKTKTLPSKKQESKTDKYSSRGVWFKQLTDKCFAIYGDTEPFSELFESYGGKKEYNPMDGQYWIFMHGKRTGLENELREFIISDCDVKSEENKRSGSFGKEFSIKTRNTNNVAAHDSNEYLLTKYLSKLDNLKSFSFLGITGPHKGILLLSIFYLIKTKVIAKNEIDFSESLEKVYNSYWEKIYGSAPTLGASYPFVHLGKDSLLTHTFLRPLHNYDKTWNRHEINKYIKKSVIDNSLFALLKDKECNKKLSDFIINRYYSSSSDSDIKTDPQNPSYNHRADFKKFLNNPDNNFGKSLSSSSLGVYLGILSNDYFEVKIGMFHPLRDIFYITDKAQLSQLLSKVEEDISAGVISPGHKVALNHYIRYISSI